MRKLFVLAYSIVNILPWTITLFQLIKAFIKCNLNLSCMYASLPTATDYPGWAIGMSFGYIFILLPMFILPKSQTMKWYSNKRIEILLFTNLILWMLFIILIAVFLVYSIRNYSIEPINVFILFIMDFVFILTPISGIVLTLSNCRIAEGNEK